MHHAARHRSIASLANSTLIISAAVSLILALAYAGDVAADRKYIVEVISPEPLLPNPPHEYPEANVPVGQLVPGEPVKVLRVRYGKDFEALKIERASGETGWVLTGGGLKVRSRGK